MVYVLCYNAQLNLIMIILSYIALSCTLYLSIPSCNLFTQHVSYLLWRDTTSELWTPVHFLRLIKPPNAIICSLLLSAIITIFHTVHLILCLQQAREIDNLSVLLGQSSFGCSVCRLHVTRRLHVGDWT